MILRAIQRKVPTDTAEDSYRYSGRFQQKCVPNNISLLRDQMFVSILSPVTYTPRSNAHVTWQPPKHTAESSYNTAEDSYNNALSKNINESCNVCVMRWN